MKRIAWFVLVIIVLFAGSLLYFIAQGVIDHSNVLPVSERIEYYKLYVDLAKAVLVGFGAALLAILIPAVFAEARLSFERLRDSRTAYSEAKTGVNYLPVRLCALDFKRATAHVQQVHVKKHEAELFPELKIHLKRRGINMTPDQWGDNLYEQLFKIRTLLEEHAGEWDSLSPSARLTLIREVLPAAPMEALVEGSVSATVIKGETPKKR